mmetsp:Transcript_101649/g.296345  ORF Transcript_101649/g.296345 Transcript_101649/m.296345 type:complete len:230 (+) Transcript_101649:80-769(+)
MLIVPRNAVLKEGTAADYNMCCVLNRSRLYIRPGAETARRAAVEADSAVSMVMKVFCTRRPGSVSRRRKGKHGGGKSSPPCMLSDSRNAAASCTGPASWHPQLEAAQALLGRASKDLGFEGWACFEPSVPTSMQAAHSVLAGAVVRARAPEMPVSRGSMRASSPWLPGCQLSSRNCPRVCAYLHCNSEHGAPQSMLGQIFVHWRSGIGRSSGRPCANLQSLPLRQRPLP